MLWLQNTIMFHIKFKSTVIRKCAAKRKRRTTDNIRVFWLYQKQSHRPLYEQLPDSNKMYSFIIDANKGIIFACNWEGNKKHQNFGYITMPYTLFIDLFDASKWVTTEKPNQSSSNLHDTIYSLVFISRIQNHNAHHLTSF